MVSLSLLDTPVFEVIDALGRSARCTLPEVLARLSAGELLTFVRLRPHQQPPWHAFMVQLAYLAMEGDAFDDRPLDAAGWTRRLRAITSDWPDDAPWCLLVEDWSRPAFLQPPCSEAGRPDFRHVERDMQSIDVLVTSRNHDEKIGKLPLDDHGLDALVYALVVLQGWSSFLGKGNYHSMRMNGGFSSRPQFRLAFERGSGAEFMRDLHALLDYTPQLWDAAERVRIGKCDHAPHSLLWTLTWDGGSLALADIHPLCLEVCRRVRLVREGGTLRLMRAGSDAARVAAKDMAGCVLDPWTPLVVDDAGQRKALTAQHHTLGYRKLHELLFDPKTVELPVLAKPTDAERATNRPATLIAQVLVSGDGRTDGLIRREVPMAPPVVARWHDAPQAIGARARAQVELAATITGKALRPALFVFVDGGRIVAGKDKDVEWKNRDFDRVIAPWVERFEQAIDEAFFGELFAQIEAGIDDAAGRRRWIARLSALAREHLDWACESLPTRERSRFLARQRAADMLRRAVRKQFPDAWSPTDDAGADLNTERHTNSVTEELHRSPASAVSSTASVQPSD